MNTLRHTRNGKAVAIDSVANGIIRVVFPLNYRGISLMLNICKVLSYIRNNRLVLFAQLQDIYSDEQNGFRKLRSCLDCLFVLHTILRNKKQQRLETYCCFVDFAKAFDSVNYDALWHTNCWYMLSTETCLEPSNHFMIICKIVFRVNDRLTDCSVKWQGWDREAQ